MANNGPNTQSSPFTVFLLDWVLAKAAKLHRSPRPVAQST